MTNKIFIKEKLKEKFKQEYFFYCLISNFSRYTVYASLMVQTVLKITSWQLMILLVMMFNATCFTRDISLLATYLRFYITWSRMVY